MPVITSAASVDTVLYEGGLNSFTLQYENGVKSLGHFNTIIIRALKCTPEMSAILNV